MRRDNQYFQKYRIDDVSLKKCNSYFKNQEKYWYIPYFLYQWKVDLVLLKHFVLFFSERPKKRIDQK